MKFHKISSIKYLVWCWISLLWGIFPILLALTEPDLGLQVKELDPVAILLLLSLWTPGAVAIRLWVQSESFDSFCEIIGLGSLK